MSKETEFGGNAFGVPLFTPTFDPAHSDTWFVQLEASLRLRGVTKRTTWFLYAVTTLPSTVASHLKEITSKQPDNNSYDRLKEAVISSFSVSREKRLQQIFSTSELGDRYPTQLLRHMRSLASGCELDDGVLKELWLNCLPRNVAPFLIGSPFQDDLDKLAEVAKIRIADPLKII